MIICCTFEHYFKKMAKKVLRILNRFNIGGPTSNAAYLSKYLSNDFETKLIGGEKCDSEDSSEYILREMGIKPVIIKEMQRKINPRKDLIAYKKIKQIIKEYKPDIVHTHASKAGMLGRLAAINMNVPIIIHTFHGHIFHSYFSTYKTKVFKEIERKLANRSSKIIAISERQQYELSEVYKIAEKDKFSVIPLGFDLSKFHENIDFKRKQFRKEYKIADDEIAIAIVGRLAPIKNHKLFLEAIKFVVNNSSKKIRAFIVGDGESRDEIIKKAEKLGLSYSLKKERATINFTSWIIDVDSVYAGVDIVTLTSLNEGTPVSLIEAQAANRPVLSTKVGGIENVVIEEKTGLLANSNDFPDYSNKLLELVENNEFRYELSKQGWENVKERYSYESLVRNTESLYNELLLQQS